MPTVTLPSGITLALEDSGPGREDASVVVLTHGLLVVHGTADAAIPVERAQAVADGVRDCRGLVLIEDGTHAVNLSHPDEVNAALVELLTGL